jgi:hypothetical protein
MLTTVIRKIPVRPEMTKFKMSREKVNMDFYIVGITFYNTGR